jgi:hypothetical protein
MHRLREAYTPPYQTIQKISSFYLDLPQILTMALGNPTTADVPHVDLLTYTFESDKKYDQQKVRTCSPESFYISKLRIK